MLWPSGERPLNIDNRRVDVSPLHASCAYFELAVRTVQDSCVTCISPYCLVVFTPSSVADGPYFRRE